MGTPSTMMLPSFTFNFSAGAASGPSALRRALAARPRALRARALIVPPARAAAAAGAAAATKRATGPFPAKAFVGAVCRCLFHS
jgi:hypothetical protein